MRPIQIPIIFIASAVLTACAIGPDYKRPEIPLTPTYAGGGALAGDATHKAWWEAFNDSLLNQAIERALAQNLDLTQVQARVEQARAIARRAGANLMPAIDSNASAERVHASLESPLGGIAHAIGAARDYNDYSVGVQASWEIDVFGGLRRSREAAQAEAQSAETSAEAMRLSIAAEVADAYIALRGLQARLAVAEVQEQTQEKLLELVRHRFREGVSSNRELQRAIGALEGVRASVPPLRALIDGQLNRLDVLMGAQAGTHRAEFLASSAVPRAAAPSGSMTPGDLMRRRPDVVAAEYRLIAANARIGAALSEYYPHISIGAMLGFASLGTSTLFTQEAKQALGMAGLRWRLFDFGRIDAEVAAARGREAEALAAYRSAILKATEDVETALSRYTQSGIETKLLERQLVALRAAREQTWLAYQNGVVGLIDVLDADRELLAASDKLATAQSEAARASIAAFRALGGGWNS